VKASKRGTADRGLAEFLYVNTARIEVLAKEADGFPPWSGYDVLFSIPGALAGMVVGVAFVVFKAWVSKKH
jgi:hypothetical protein